jgi:hypothetical protein
MMAQEITNGHRFRSQEEYELYFAGKIPMSDLIQPFIMKDGFSVRNPEYDDAPYGVGYVYHGKKPYGL